LHLIGFLLTLILVVRDEVQRQDFFNGLKTGISYKQQKRKDNWMDHILHRNSLIKHVIEGKIQGRIDVTVRRRRSIGKQVKR